MKEVYSIKEAIQITIEELGEIDVPMKYKKQIADKIAVAIMNLQVIKDAIKEDPVQEATNNAETNVE